MVLSQLRKGKFTSYPKTRKESIGVGRISKFHAGAGIKQNRLSLPFPKATKTNVLGHHYFAPKHRETSQIKFKRKMAPTIAPKINLTLKTGAGSTAGARAGSPAAADRSTAAKRQKTAEGGTLRVSSNLDGRKRRVNPPRLATAKAGADGSLATAGANGSPGRNTAGMFIPSDDDDENEPIEAAASTAPRKPRKGGRATIDDQPSTNRKMASGTALAGRCGAAPEEGAVVWASLPTGTPLTMEDDDKSGDDIDDDVDDGFDDDEDVDHDNPKYGDDAAGLVDRPFGGWAPTGGTHPTRGRPTSRATERKRPFKEEASRAQGVRGADARARNRSASGGGAAENKPQGKTGQGVSSANFFVADKRQSEKEADRAHGVTVVAGTRQT
jgi:hypothetical protein